MFESLRVNITGQRYQIQAGTADAGIEQQLLDLKTAFSGSPRQHGIFEYRQKETTVSA